MDNTPLMIHNEKYSKNEYLKMVYFETAMSIDMENHDNS